MARDALATLSRIRAVAVTEASRALAAAQNAEATVARSVDEHTSRVLHETASADASQGDELVAWLNVARAKSNRLQVALGSARANVAALRQTLALRRADAEIVAKARERAAQEAALERARREQSVLDEVAGQRTRPARRGDMA